MDQTQVTEWLRKSLRNQIVISAAGAFAIFLAGIGILVLTLGFVYVVSLFALGPWLGYHHWAHVSLGLALIPALFWGNARTSQEYLSEYSVTSGTASDTVVSFYLPGVGTGSNVNPLAPDTIHTGVKMITDILYSGPRVVAGAFRLLCKCMRLRRVDLEACGAVLFTLFGAHRKLSFQEIVAAIPWINPVAVFPQLHEIEGIVFLIADPPGLTPLAGNSGRPPSLVSGKLSVMFEKLKTIFRRKPPRQTRKQPEEPEVAWVRPEKNQWNVTIL